MNIIIISAVFPPEPVVSAKLSYDLATALSEKENVIVVSPTPTRPYGFNFEKQTQKGRFKHLQLNSYTCPESRLFGRLRETYSFGKACYQFIREHQNSIAYIYSNTWPLFAQYYSVKAARRFNIPITIHVQDVYPESLANKLPFGGRILNKILLPFDKFTCRNATRIVAISENMKQHLSVSRKVDDTKISIVANWQDENAFINYNTENIPRQAQPFTFMYLGNIGPVAGIELLIESFAKAMLTNCRLVIAGSGSIKSNLVKQAAQYPKAHIDFWMAPVDEVPEIQSFADVMLLPMRKGAASSSIPSKLPAYLFSKKPVIACVEESSDTAKAIRNGECGWILPPENMQLLADCMKNVSTISSEDLLIRGSKGYTYALEEFSKKNNLPKLLNLINTSN